MENGAGEPEQSEASAEIAKSADVEDSSTTKSPTTEGVHEQKENALTEKSVHTNDAGSSPYKDEIVKSVAGTDASVTTADSEVSTGSQVLESQSPAAAADIKNTSSTNSQASPHGVQEVEEPEKETKESPEVRSESSLASNSEPLEDSAVVDKKETEPATVVAVHEEVAAESTEHDPQPVVEKLSEEKKNEDEAIKSTESESAIATDPDRIVDLSTPLESDETEQLPKSQEELPEEKLAPKDVTSAAESDVTSSVVEDKELEDPASELIKEGNDDEATPSKEGIDTTPATRDDDHTKDSEDVRQEVSSLSHSATPLAVEEDEQVESHTAHAEPTKDTVTEKLPVPPVARVEETDVADKDVEHATVEEESLKENVAHEEAPESLTAAEDEGLPQTEADETDAGVVEKEADPGPAGAESTDGTVVGEEVTKNKAPEDELPVEAVPKEDVKNVETETDNTLSTGHSVETNPAVEEKDFEALTTEEGVADEPVAIEEIDAATPLEDTKDAEAETVLPTEAKPAVEDRGLDLPTSDEALANEPAGEDIVPEIKSPEISSNTTAVDVEPLTADEFTEEESGVGGEPSTDSAEVIPAVEIQDEEASSPHEEPRQESNVADEPVEATPAVEETITTPHVQHDKEDAADGETRVPEIDGPGPVEHDDVVDSVPAEVQDKEETLGGEVPPAGALPTVEDKDVAAPTLPEEHANVTATVESGSAGDDGEVNPVSELSSLKDGVGEIKVSEEKVPSTEDFSEATPAVEDRGVEAATTPEQPFAEEPTDEIVSSQEVVPEVTAGSEHASPAAEEKDVDAPPPEVKEEISDEEAEHAEPVTGDEVLSQKDAEVQDTSATVDTPESSPVIENTSPESSKDVEATTSHEDLTRALSDEVSSGTDSGEMITPEDEGYVIVDKDSDSSSAVQDMDVEAPTPQEEEHVSPDEVAHKEADHTSEALTQQEELVKGETDDEAAQSSEHVAEELPLATASEDTIFAAENKDFEAPVAHEELAKEDTTPDDASLVSDSSQGTSILEDDALEGSAAHEGPVKEGRVEEIAPIPEHVEAIDVEDARGVEPETLDEDVNEERSTSEEAPVDSADTVEEKGVEAAASHETLAKEETSDSDVPPVEPVEATLPEKAGDEELGENEAKKDGPIEEGTTATPYDDAIRAPDQTDAVVPETQHEEPAKEETAEAEEKPPASVLAAAVPAAEDKDVDAPTPHEEHAKEETADEVAQSQESPAAEIESTTASQSREWVPDGALLTTGHEGAVPPAEGEEVNVSTASEDPATDDVAQSQESGEGPSLESTKEAGDQDKEPILAEDVSLPTSSHEEVPAVEEKNVEASISHEELAKEAAPGDIEPPTPEQGLTEEETVTEDSASIPVNNATTAEPVVAAEEELETRSTAEEQASATDSAELPHAEDGKGVEATTRIVEVADDDTAASESALAPESVGVSPTVESEAVGPAATKEVGEVPAPHEQPAQEETISRELPTTPESAVVTPIEDKTNLEPEATGGNERSEGNEETTPVDETSSTKDFSEPAGGLATEDAELPTEVPQATGPIIEDKEVESPAHVHEDLTLAEEVPADTEPAQEPVPEVTKDFEPGTRDFIPSEAALPASEELSTKGSEANVVDLEPEPAEIIDKHVLTADAPKTLPAEITETDQPGKESEEQAAGTEKGALPGEGLVPDGDISKKALESPEAVAKEGSEGLTLGGQEGEEAQVESDVQSALQATSSSNEIQSRDFEIGLRQELQQEKIHSVAQQEDKASVPLSIHTADLSSSWINVSPIRSAEVTSAPAGSHSNLSQRPRPSGSEEDLPLSGGEDWRIVSEQDISALGQPKDLDSGSSGAKFPFSIVLWCSQSMASLFGGSQK